MNSLYGEVGQWHFFIMKEIQIIDGRRMAKILETKIHNLRVLIEVLGTFAAGCRALQLHTISSKTDGNVISFFPIKCRFFKNSMIMIE